MTAVARERAIVAGAFAALAALATVWLAIDRTPPEWDHANHLERVVHCAADMARGDLRRIFERSTFYPPVVPCAAALVYRLAPSDAIGSQAVVLAFLGLGMAAVYLLGRHVAGGTEGVVAAVIFGTAPFVVFSSLRFQLDLPLAALVPLTILVLLKTDGFTHGGWSLVAGGLLGLGMLTKPTFAAYVLAPLVLLAARTRRAGAWINVALAVLVGAVVSAPWYGPRLFGLLAQIASRSFKQAAEAGKPEPLTTSALLVYPTWFAPQFGILAVLLCAAGLVVALWRRQGLIVTALLAPFVLLQLLQNKDLRYTLPLLPIAAVLAGLGFGVVPPRGRRVARIILGVVCALQVVVTASAFPRGLTLPWVGVPLVVESAPRRGDWHHREILGLISRDSGGRAATVSVVPNDNLFSVSNFRYYAARDGLPLEFVRAWEGDPIGVEYMILKTGALGPSWTVEKPRRVGERLRDDPHLARVYPILADFPLPDGSTGSVRARRLTEAADATPAALSREVEAAVHEALADVARDVEGLEVRVVHDDTILKGRVGRIEIRAASAVVGEFRRPKAARLRVHDVRVAFEDVLVNPFAVHTAGRLDPLDAGRVAIEQVTVREKDLQAFLGELKEFRGASVKLEPGAAAFVITQPGPDVAARIRLLPADDRPFTLVAEHVSVGGIPLPSTFVNWVVRNYDPSPRLARRLPVPVRIGSVDVTPEAVRITTKP